MKVEGVATAAFDLHIFGKVPEGLHLQDQRAREFRLQGAHEHEDFEVAAAQERQVLWLDVFKIDQDEIGFQEGFLVGVNNGCGGRLSESCGGGQFYRDFSGVGYVLDITAQSV